MMKRLLLLLLILIFTLLTLPFPAKSLPPKPPILLNSSNPKTNQIQNSCSYTVTIRTSCTSPPFTRDYISLSFGDAYGNQVYVPRLDDPSSRAFERCSSDTYRLTGPCARRICYVYLMRRGYDGWMPESVTISSGYFSRVTFFYNMFLPNGVWILVNRCNNGAADISATTSTTTTTTTTTAM